MREPRVQPPPLVGWSVTAGRYLCPLEASPVEYHRFPGTAGCFACPRCQAFWPEADVTAGRPGRWDDSGTRCPASLVCERGGTSGRVELSCVLGDDHADGLPPGEFAVHVDRDGTRWFDGGSLPDQRGPASAA